MSKPDIWMQWFIGSYLADTMHLTTEQHGAYDLLLMHGWKNHGRIPGDDRQLAQITKMTPAKWRIAKPILLPFFSLGQDPETGGYWFQKRQMEEIQKAKERQDGAGTKARRAAEARWSKDATSIATSTAQALPRDASSPTPSDPPYSPPSEFRTAFPILCRVFGIENPSHRDELTMFEAWSELRAKKATSTDLARRIARYREIWPDMPCTPNAVLKHWHTCKPLEKPVPVSGGDAIPDSLLEDGDD